MKLIIGIIFGIIVLIFIKRFSQKNNKNPYILIFLSTLIFIVMVDFALRTFEIVKGDLFVQRNSSEIIKNINVHNYRSQKDTGHPYMLYTSKPGFKGNLPLIEPGQTYKISINGHGFRTKKFYPKLPGKVRVVIMGDSFMWGYNANQDETAAAALEKIIHKNISDNIEVLSLGVPSYSGVRYAALTRIYLDYLNPDILIVAVDQSDFGEDVNRFDEYVLDEAGYPLILKNAEKIIKDEENSFLAIDVDGNITKEKISFNRKDRIQIGSPLAENAIALSDYIIKKSKLFLKNKDNEKNLKITENNFSKNYPNINIVTYQELFEKFGDDISEGLPGYIAVDMIPFTLDRAINEYKNTYKSLEYIRNETSKRNQTLYLSSYPYPFMITPFENINYHLKFRNNDHLFDFSKNRVHPDLLDYFASELGVIHVNSYPDFENNYQGMWGEEDPHFSPRGYELFANSLYKGIKDELNRRLTIAKNQSP